MERGELSKVRKKKSKSKCGCTRTDDGSHNSDYSRHHAARKEKVKTVITNGTQRAEKGKEHAAEEEPSNSFVIAHIDNLVFKLQVEREKLAKNKTGRCLERAAVGTFPAIRLIL